MSVRLQLRNPVALAYSYAIPLVFLGAFWTLYRHESPPLGRHLGQLLTITALSGACFAVPAWLVSERERGVWRQYRLTPAPGGVHLVGMLGASYLLLLSAGALQIAAAAVVGTPLPSHLFHLWIAFTLTSAAFLGIGLLITMAREHRAGRAGARSGCVPADAHPGRRRRATREPPRLGAGGRVGVARTICRRCHRRSAHWKWTRPARAKCCGARDHDRGERPGVDGPLSLGSRAANRCADAPSHRLVLRSRHGSPWARS